MTIHRRAARRDDNEQVIAHALEAAGASVTYLSAPGCPDLLVGIAGRTVLLEVKRERGPRGGKRGGGRSRPGMGGDGELTKDQIEWRAAWKGAAPITVYTPGEALKAIGCAP